MIVYNLADRETALALTMAFASGERPKKRYLFFAEAESRAAGFISESFLGTIEDESAYVDMFLDYLARAQGNGAEDDEAYDEDDFDA